VPTDFIEATLAVPHPSETGLYIKLRDDPSAIHTVPRQSTPSCSRSPRIRSVHLFDHPMK